MNHKIKKMSNNASLIQKLPPENLQTWALKGESFIIGRHPTADAALPFLSVSRHHAQITISLQGYFLEDLNSHNGTFVNGERLRQGARLLRTGDEIVLGGQVALIFQDPYETIDGKMIGRVTGIWIDPQTGAVWVDSQLLVPPLSPPQQALLALLYQQAGQVLSQAQIITQVWPDEDPQGISKDAVNGLIKRLRARLREIQPEKDFIEVVRGHGLRLNQDL